MKTLEDKLQYLFKEDPALPRSNTNTCLALWEMVATVRGADMNDWFEMKLIIKDYPPESITRARRKLTKSTEAQREKEEDYRLNYMPDHCQHVDKQLLTNRSSSAKVDIGLA